MVLKNKTWYFLQKIIQFQLIFGLVIGFGFCLTASANNFIPTSQKSQKIANKLAPQLQKQFAKKKLTWGNPLYVRVFKKSKKLEVWVQDNSKFKLFKTYDIYNFSGDIGPKVKQGDKQSPEGFYKITSRQLNPWSSYHLSFNVGYPNSFDIQHQRTGGAIMVHGGKGSSGCFAMLDPQIEEIYTLVAAALKNGQEEIQMDIYPFRMTGRNMRKYSKHAKGEWKSFWKDLKVGYDFFRRHKHPAPMMVENKRYVLAGQEKE